jgi:hypothetical protein
MPRKSVTLRGGTIIAGALALAGATATWAPLAAASPTELTVRIEGATQTLFEGPILTDGHKIRAASDSVERPCDGANGGAHPTPGPTPTAAAADAMELVGQGFDGAWFPGFDDYFVERWGPDAQQGEAFWGVFANGVLTPVGGCQWEDSADDEVLWALDAFSGRSELRLAAADDSSPAPGPPSPTAEVEVGKPLALMVQSYAGAEGANPEVKPAAGVTVAPVATEAGTGFETTQTGDPSAVTTGADGAASVTFAEPGWRRVKAQSEATHIRSNRLDVCVEPPGGGGCGPLPPDARLRVPARYLPGPGLPPAPPVVRLPPGTVPSVGSLRLGKVSVDQRAGMASLEVELPGAGRVALSGAGIRSRSIDAAAAGPLELRIVPTEASRRALRKRGRVALIAQVTFTSAAGTTSSETRKLTLRVRARRG